MEALKPVVKTLADLGEKISTALADGKLSTSEMFTLLLALTPVSDIIQNKDAIAQAWKDRTPEGLAELSTYAKDELNLDNADLEAKIEAVIDLALAGANVISLFQKKAETPAA